MSSRAMAHVLGMLQLPPGAVDRGTLQRLQSDAAMYCGMLVCFCRKLKWDTLATLFAALQVPGLLPSAHIPLSPPIPRRWPSFSDSHSCLC